VAVRDTTIDRTDDRDLAWLITAVLAGPSGWALTQGAGYAAVKPVCAGGDPFVLGLVALVALVASAAGGWFAWRRLSALRSVAADSGARDVDRSFFIAAVATGMNLLIALLTVTTVASQLLGRCE
jgi:hypothetical protein